MGRRPGEYTVVLMLSVRSARNRQIHASDCLNLINVFYTERSFIIIIIVVVEKHTSEGTKEQRQM